MHDEEQGREFPTITTCWTMKGFNEPLHNPANIQARSQKKTQLKKIQRHLRRSLSESLACSDQCRRGRCATVGGGVGVADAGLSETTAHTQERKTRPLDANELARGQNSTSLK